MDKQSVIKPIQPYFVMNTKKYYTEVYGKHGISHFYTYIMDSADNQSEAVPDGSVDIVFEYDENHMNAHVCGTVLAHQSTFFQNGKTYFGVRFMPGECPAILDSSLKELVNNQARLEPVLKSAELVEQMSEQKTFHNRIQKFLEIYERQYQMRNEKNHPSEILAAAMQSEICEKKGVITMADLEECTGYSTRYLNKVFTAEMGIGPKVFGKIIQFQVTLKELNSMENSNSKLTDVAAELGYYDQSQLIHSFRKYANITPKEYRKLIQVKEYKKHLIKTNCFTSTDFYNFN